MCKRIANYTILTLSQKFFRLCINFCLLLYNSIGYMLRKIIDCIACITYEPGIIEYQDFPATEEPVWLLGKKYNALHDLESLRNDVRTRLWFTYRKNFSPIGGTGPTTDAGWGCMLRCGQMVLAQALINRHLGRDWLWKAEEKNSLYCQILKLFQDRKNSLYSIHQIAQMGVSEGKNIGEWFGPNTVAHVLKKLVVYDDWSSIKIHVAMDNVVIINDIKTLCKTHPKISNSVTQDINKGVVRSRYTGGSNDENKINSVPFNDTKTYLNNSSMQKNSIVEWYPLLMFIPLRLGLFEINPIYFNALKASFSMNNSLGIIGGRPNHALYFIGTVGEELVFLDPHTTQPTVDLDESMNDESYHCGYSGRMNLNQLDPSISLCFFCNTETEFDKWCNQSKQLLVTDQAQPLFEIFEDRPLHIFSLSDNECEGGAVKEERKFDPSDEEFELL
ncbi:cysteine protease ATG4B-like isoform X2 [Centruroides vittatus]